MTSTTFDKLKANAGTIPPYIEEDELPTYRGSDKAQLCGLPLIVTEWSLKNSDSYGTIAECYAVTSDNQEIKFVDTGVGIRAQLVEWEEKQGETPIYLPQGLRASHYKTKSGTTATTYYLSS